MQRLSNLESVPLRVQMVTSQQPPDHSCASSALTTPRALLFKQLFDFPSLRSSYTQPSDRQQRVHCDCVVGRCCRTDLKPGQFVNNRTFGWCEINTCSTCRCGGARRTMAIQVQRTKITQTALHRNLPAPGQQKMRTSEQGSCLAMSEEDPAILAQTIQL
jgi:hypothetical protein